MSANDGRGEKTEKPTPKRLRDARKKGQFAKTQEAPVAMRFIVITAFFVAFGHRIFHWLQSLIYITFKSVNDPLPLSLAKFLNNISGFIFQIWMPFMIAMIVALCASFIIQIGFFFSTETIKPSLKKISLIQGVKNLFSKKKLFDLLKNVLRIVVLAVVFYHLLMSYRNDFQFLPYYDTGAGLLLMGRILFYLMLVMIFFSIIISVVDFVFEKRRITKQLMMSLDEIKKEYKETEGSPEIKSKRKELHHEIQSGSLGAKVKRSSVVVRNPTEIAVCLYYNPGKTPLPIVIEKRTGQMAKRIFELSKQYGIPVVTNVAVARRLYKTIAVGEYITRDMMVAVAIILRSVMTADQRKDIQQIERKKDDE